MTIWNPDLSQYPGPRYKALALAIKDGIEKGDLVSGQRLPTHRSLAEMLSVTVGTVTRGYAEAERRDLITARMGSGTFIRGEVASVSDFFIPAGEQAGLIDLSLSFAPSCGEEKALSETLSELSQQPESLKALLRYQAESGMPRFRQAVVRWLEYCGVSVDEEAVLICCGGQNAINIALQAVTRPGDRVLAEGVTYPGFLGALKQQHLLVAGVPLDEKGIIPEQLDSFCSQYQPTALYCNPTLQNPTTVTVSRERRLDLLAVAEKHDLLILEDEVQAGLKENRPESLYVMNPDRVIHIGSFSKTLAGGLRVGYILCPKRYMPRARTALRSSFWMVPPLMAEIATSWIISGRAERLLKLRRAEIARRYEHVRRVFRGFDYNGDPAAYNIWLRLPEPWRSDEFARQLERNGVLVKPSGTFVAGRYQAEHAVRVCIGSPSHHSLVEKGLKIIRSTLEEGPDMIEPVM